MADAPQIKSRVYQLEGNGPTWERGRRRAITYNPLTPIWSHSSQESAFTLNVNTNAGCRSCIHCFICPYDIGCSLQMASKQPRRMLITQKHQLPMSSCLWNFWYADLMKNSNIFLPLALPSPIFVPAWAMSERRAAQPACKNWVDTGLG